MKKQIIGLALFAINCFVSLISCKKNETSNPATLLQTLRNDPTLTIYSAIESKAGDDALFLGGYTYIVPTDSAFIKAGISLSAAQGYSQPACDSIIRYYIIPSALNFSGYVNTETSFATSLGSSNVFGDSSGTTVYFNGIASAMPVIFGTSAVYELSSYLRPPVVSVSALVSADLSITLFNEAMNRTNLAATLSGGIYTLFIPTDSAFINAGYSNIAAIDSADINVLTQLLLYHIIGGRYFPNDITQQTTLMTLQGEMITANPLNNRIQLIGNSDPLTPATTLNDAILVNNNIAIYKISQVLIP